MIDGLARIFRMIELEWDVVSPVLKIVETGDYEQTLAQLFEAEKFSDEEWETSALVSLLVVAWRPETAHEWLELVVSRLCSGECRWARQGLHQGSFLGLLEAGVWLDKELGQTKFQTTLLQKLMELVCNGKPRKPMRLPHGGRDVDYSNFHKRLTEALPKFLFPEKTNHILISEGDPAPQPPELSEKEMKQQRTDETKKAVQYLRQHLGTGELTWFAKLFVEQLAQVLLAKTTPAQKISAVQHVIE